MTAGSPGPSPIQRIAARVRRLPGYRTASGRAATRARHSATLNDIVWRVFPPQSDLGATRRAMRGGRHLAGADVDLLPVVGFDLFDVARADLAGAVDRIAQLQRDTRGFRVVLILAVPEFGLAREHGYVVELIAAPEDWWGPPEDHVAYVARRMVSVVQGFRLWHLVRVGPDGQVPERDAAMLAQVLPAMARTVYPDIRSGAEVAVSPGREVGAGGS